jgi:hypothetical protein
VKPDEQMLFAKIWNLKGAPARSARCESRCSQEFSGLWRAASARSVLEENKP